MTISREDLQLLLQLDQVHRPGREAKQFIWSETFGRAASGGTFFDTFALDSDERFHVNEVATYYDKIGLLWRSGVVHEEAVFEWVTTAVYWDRMGSVLIKAREVLGSEALGKHFEALAIAQRGG